MNYTKQTKAALVMAVMAMLSSTCYAGVDVSAVDAQQTKGNQANFRWEAVNQEAKKMTVENPQAEVKTEKSIPIIITAADIDAQKKKSSHSQQSSVSSEGTQPGIIDALGNNAGGGNANTGSNGADSLGGVEHAAGNGVTPGGSGANDSERLKDSGSSDETSLRNGTHSVGAKGVKAIDDSDTDLRIYPLEGNGAVSNSGGVSSRNVVALPEPEPVAAMKPVNGQSAVVAAEGQTVPLPPVQPVAGEPANRTVLSSGRVVELPPIEKVAQARAEVSEKIVELPPIHSVK